MCVRVHEWGSECNRCCGGGRMVQSTVAVVAMAVPTMYHNPIFISDTLCSCEIQFSHNSEAYSLRL